MFHKTLKIYKYSIYQSRFVQNIYYKDTKKQIDQKLVFPNCLQISQRNWRQELFVILFYWK